MLRACALFALTVTATIGRSDDTWPRSGQNQLRVATYNIHSCKGLDSRCACERIAGVLRSTHADVIALEEVRANQAGEIAHDLGFEFVFAHADTVHGYDFGNAVLSRFPIIQTLTFPIGVPGRQQRACLRADILWFDPALAIHVFAVHLGLKKEERKAETLRLLSGEILGDPALRHAPVLLLGDFNEKSPGGFANKHLSARLRGIVRRSWPGFLPIVYLDRIYYNDVWKARSAHVGGSASALIASDHAPVTADFELDHEAASPRNKLTDR